MDVNFYLGLTFLANGKFVDKQKGKREIYVSNRFLYVNSKKQGVSIFHHKTQQQKCPRNQGGIFVVKRCGTERYF
jgi:hypothetical protein